jgi:hypothetical protein
MVRGWLLVTAAAVVLSGCQTQSPAPEAVPMVIDGEEVTVIKQPVLELEVGSCLMDTTTPIGQDFVNIPVIDCDLPHESEVYAEVILTGSGFPGVEKVSAEAVSACRIEFAEFVGLDHALSALDFHYYYPTPSSWAVGDRSVFCVVFDPGVLTVGSLAGQAR